MQLTNSHAPDAPTPALTDKDKQTKRNREADQKRWEANNRKWMIHRNRAAAWKAGLK